MERRFFALCRFLFAINYFDDKSDSFFTCFSFILIAFAFTLLTYAFFMFFYRREIKFTSRCIEFIQKGKVKRRYRITKNHDMIRLFL